MKKVTRWISIIYLTCLVVSIIFGLDLLETKIESIQMWFFVPVAIVLVGLQLFRGLIKKEGLINITKIEKIAFPVASSLLFIYFLKFLNIL